MKKYFLLGLLLFVGNIVLGSVNSGMDYPIKVVNGKSYYEYPVQKSEGFYSISKRFGVTEDEIKAVNPGTEKGLTFNSVILIPIKERSYITHKVDKKETLYSLSKKYDVTYDDLYALNPNLKEEGLKYGTEVKIPEKKTISVQTMTVSDTVKKIKKENKPTFTVHDVKKGETLFSISRHYGILQEEILKLNPDAADGLKIGKKLIIPPVFANTAMKDSDRNKPAINYTYHTVKKRETLYSLTKKYSIKKEEIIRLNPSVKDGLKEGMVVIIPPVFVNTHLVSDSLISPQDSLTMLEDSLKNDSILNLQDLFVRSTTPKTEINIAIALPFQLNKVTDKSKIDGNTNKILEFYQGFLIAIDSLKRSGLSFNLSVFDSGKSEEDMRAMLESSDLTDMDIMIGPAYTAQIKPLSEFAMKNNVKLINPFSSKADETLVNPNIFQINTPEEQLNFLMSELFIKEFKDKNIVLLSFSNESYNDKKTFADTLSQMLIANKIAYKSLVLSNVSALRNALVSSKENIIVPITTNQVALSQVLPMINMLPTEKTKVAIFGFTEWQGYQSISKDLFVVNTYFASPFYLDFQEDDVRSYLKNFRRFYHAEPMNTLPQYGMFGYDLAMYFSTAISKYGHDFEISIDSIKCNTLQSDFHFKRISETGGFYNSCVFMTNHNDVTGLSAVNGVTMERYPIERKEELKIKKK